MILQKAGSSTNAAAGSVDIMNNREYQLRYSELHPSTAGYMRIRSQKAQKMISIISEVCSDLGSKSLLDVGCSKGIMSALYGETFGSVTGIDIDEPGIEYAIKNSSSDKVRFLLRSGDDTGFDDETFDVITCTHIYEHVPDAQKLMAEIHRVLKPGGVCYFTGGNRFVLIEAHYKLPLLSAIPKPLSHFYLRLLRRGNHYYEKHLTYWSLRKLVSAFEIIDFTKRIIDDPARYHATEMLTPGSLKQKLARTVLGAAYFLSPTYVWILRKRAG